MLPGKLGHYNLVFSLHNGGIRPDAVRQWFIDMVMAEGQEAVYYPSAGTLTKKDLKPQQVPPECTAGYVRTVDLSEYHDARLSRELRQEARRLGITVKP